MEGGRAELLDLLKRLEARLLPDTRRDWLSDYEAMRIHVFRDNMILNRVQRRFETYGLATMTGQSQHVRGMMAVEDPVVTSRAAEVYFEAAARNHVTLGGVRIPYAQGVRAHSDGDVALHALCDALLGAMALGDIGEHFPNTDPQYRNISSLALLGNVGSLLDARGYALVSIDAMVILEHPKILPHAMAMCAAIAGTLGVSPSLVSIKATTSEGLGFAGRGEGAAAHAVAAIVHT